MSNKRKSTGTKKGVGYCPFPVLGHDTAVVSPKEGLRHARQARLHARPRTCVRAQACLGRPFATDLLGLSVATRVFSVVIGRCTVGAFGVAT